MWLGVISYGLYVVHNPIRLLSNRLDSPIETLIQGDLPSRLAYMALLGIISVGVAAASWYGFETHFLKLKDRVAKLEPAGAHTKAGLEVRHQV
jgi:peptidoglycan/LPS O-acetylase OafA/YrhL